ncbi:unnamed protein product [Citrullus colocynthis]|uniref:Uncharacterized protein n=1 Tax=Citrullus colocynthis TaxID=252529 RepID=A0ABP0Y6U9_9ROSI
MRLEKWSLLVILFNEEIAQPWSIGAGIAYDHRKKKWKHRKFQAKWTVQTRNSEDFYGSNGDVSFEDLHLAHCCQDGPKKKRTLVDAPPSGSVSISNLVMPTFNHQTLNSIRKRRAVEVYDRQFKSGCWRLQKIPHRRRKISNNVDDEAAFPFKSA